MGNFEEVYAVLRETEQYLPKELFDKVFEELEKADQKSLDDATAIADMSDESGYDQGYENGWDDAVKQLKEQGELNGGS
mgnify:CR=1 FL=1